MTLVKSRVLAVSGLNADTFLQGQLTCDVLALENGQSCLGAYCNIKGKIDSLFRLFKTDNSFLLQMQPELLEATQKELQKYAVFSKVTLELVDYQLPGVDDVAEIKAKIPALYPQTVGAFFPHDLNLPALGGVSFTKGCYRGQEIVARMQHRGNMKRSLYAFACDQESKPGDIISITEGNAAGTVVRTAILDQHTIGLSVITDSLHTESLQVNGNAIKIV